MTRAARSLVAAIDQGTTSSRCFLFDRAGRPIASHQLPHRQITPRPGWVEHDADEILYNVRACVRGALAEAGADATALAAVGISNQRETTVVWSRRTGKPIANAIVWQDTRTAEACARLAVSDGSDVPGIDRFRAAGERPIPSRHGLITTVAARIGDGAATYALEGSVAVTGSLIGWLRDNLGMIGDGAEVEALARSVPDSGDVVFVPAFSGLFAPHWRSDARGVIAGLTAYATRGTSRVPRSKRPPTRSTTCAKRWPRISGRHSPASCEWTAG